MGYVEIYDKYQTKYETSNRIKFKAFLDIFKKETGINISSLASVYNVDITDPAKEFYFLKWVLFIYNRKYIPYFYELLDNFGYDMFSEVIDTMKLIGKDTHKNVASDIISYALISPYVDEITVDNGKKGLKTCSINIFPLVCQIFLST
ncbi:MAG: hypothetical protein K2I70_05655, partial [Bacilli bacterium]|nr:hypothetical protein [Bacilli bacterium]